MITPLSQVSPIVATIQLDDYEYKAFIEFDYDSWYKTFIVKKAKLKVTDTIWATVDEEYLCQIEEVLNDPDFWE